MAVIQKTEFDKAKRHIVKKIRILLSNAKPSKFAGRFSDIKILSNSIPKSGTHLLELYLENMQPLRNAGKKTLVAEFGEKKIHNIIRSISRGQFLNAHLAYSTKLSEVVADSNITALLLVRHPMDVAISRYNYVSFIDCTHRAHEHFRACANENEGIIKAIHGIPGLMVPLQIIYESYYPWVENKNTLLCKYESLIGDERGGSNNERLIQLENILEHFKLNNSDIDLNRIINKVEGVNTSTLRSGRAGTWRAKISDRIKDQTHVEIDRMCSLYGYNPIH